MADTEQAVEALGHDPTRVFLALGRQTIGDFAHAPQHFYLLRFVDAATPPALPHHHLVVDRGPFTLAGELALLREHRIHVIVAKNAGGSGARAKLDAARELGLPVVMIDRPFIPPRPQVGSVAAVLDWLDHGVVRGVKDRPSGMRDHPRAAGADDDDGAHIGHVPARLRQRHDAQGLFGRRDGAREQHRAVVAARFAEQREGRIQRIGSRLGPGL